MSEDMKEIKAETLADLKAKVAALEADLATKDAIVEKYN